MFKDTYKYKGLRKKLVAKLRERGIEDENILNAFEAVPRHFFLDNAFAEVAYEDKAFPIGEGQTISQPYTVAYQTMLLGVEKGDKVLEIGTGSGYQACILSKMGAKVYTIERNKKLYQKTSKFLKKIGYPQIKTFFGDGHKGLPAFAPYDKIMVTAAARSVPPALLSQLKLGGVLVIPTGGKNLQKMKRITKKGEGDYKTETKGTFKFVPMREGKNW